MKRVHSCASFGCAGLGVIERKDSLNHWSAALNQLDQQNHYCKDQQNMDEPAKRVRTHEPNCPQNKQNHKNRPKHRYHLPAIVSTVTTDHLDAVALNAVVCRYADSQSGKISFWYAITADNAAGVLCNKGERRF
jgi:hypothetical protein